MGQSENIHHTQIREEEKKLFKKFTGVKLGNLNKC